MVAQSKVVWRDHWRRNIEGGCVAPRERREEKKWEEGEEMRDLNP